MKEEPKNIWTKPWKGPGRLFLWWLLLACAGFLVVLAIRISLWNIPAKDFAMIALVGGLGSALVGVMAFLFIRWLCCWRNLRRFLLGLACFATLVALFYAVEDWRGKYAWERFKRHWEVKGERFDRSSVVPPPVPDDQNFALTPIVASSYAMYLDKSGRQVFPRNTNVVNRLLMPHTVESTTLPKPKPGDWRKAEKTDLQAWQKYYREVVSTTGEFTIPARPQNPAADVLVALSIYDSVIEELRQASRLPYSRFPLEYDAECPAAILMPHLPALKSTGLTLQLRAVAEIHNGETDKALEDVKLMLRLIESIRTDADFALGTHRTVEPYAPAGLGRSGRKQMV